MHCSDAEDIQEYIDARQIQFGLVILTGLYKLLCGTTSASI